MRLETVMWDSLRDIAQRLGKGVNDLVTEIDDRRDGLGLTAAIRVYIVDFYRSALSGQQPAATRRETLPV